MRFNSFMNFILNEEITSNGKPLGDPDQAAGGKKKKKDDEVPDFGADVDTDNNAGAGDNQEGDLPDPTSVPQDDPTQQQTPDQQDPTAGGDPNAAGGDEPVPDFGADAANDAGGGEGDPAQVGGDPNAQDPNVAGDPNAAGGEDPTATGMEDPTAAGGTGPDMQQDEIKELEDSLFQHLKPDQIKSAKINLKGQFVDLYETIDKTIERLDKIDRTSSDISTINFVVKKLFEIRTLLKEALIKNFDNKSYVENQIILQRHMAIFNALTNIIGELGKTKSAKEKKRAKRIMSGKEEYKNEKGELDGGSNDKEKKQTTDEDELKI